MKFFLKFIQTHRRIKQHATVYSLVVVIMLFVLFLEAYMHNFNLVYITLFFVFSFAFSAGHFGVLNLGNLSATFGKQGRIFAKNETSLRIPIENISTTNSWSIVLHGKDEEKVDIPHIKAQSTLVAHLPMKVDKRGSFTYARVYLESKYPLSTARLTLPMEHSYEGLAYPQPKGISLETYISQQETHLGEEKEFDGLNTYDGTQKLSHLHWASIAKGEMSIKRFTKETSIKNLHFVFEHINGNTEVRLSQLTLWALECEKKKLHFKIVLPHKTMNSSKESIDDILETLARY